MTTRRELLLATGALLAALLTGAQQAGRVYRIGFLALGTPGRTDDAFRQGLRELGYVEGQTVIVESRFAQGLPERLPDLVAELLRLKVDVLMVGSTSTALAAKKATTTVPIAFAYLNDPVVTGIVASPARPGGNITGVAAGVSGTGCAGKYLELLKEAVPGISHVAVLWNSANPANPPSVLEIEAAARKLKVKLDLLDSGSAANLDRALAAIGTSGARGTIVKPYPFFTQNRAKLVQLAASKRHPAVYFAKLFVGAGGLMSYGASL